MIKVSIVKQNSLIKTISVKGHAQFAESGKDIVCASVSSMVLVSINAIIALDENILSVKEADGLIAITKQYENDSVEKILVNLITMLHELSQDYPQHIQIQER